MGVWRFLVSFLITILSVCAAGGEESQPPALFDPARHMRVSEVKAGMTGYGLSVFSGTKIERFEVEVVSVLKNFNPKYDVILIRCRGANLEHTGAVGGMSGSPIYLKDEAGRERLVGAFAYGWAMLKDPLAGVQPIEYMLQLPEFKIPLVTTQPAGGAAKALPGESAIKPQRKIHWNLAEQLPLPKRQDIPVRYPLARLATPENELSGERMRMQPLVTPLMTSGLPARTIEQFSPLLAAYGLMPLQAGGAGGSSTGEREPAALEPGSVLAAPLLSGDVELTAIGTCTEVLGERVFAFGHPFNNEGPISLPMASGEVNGVLPSLLQSLKLGAMTKLRGALLTDQSVGIAGKLGAKADIAPIELRVLYTDGTQDVTYRFNCAMHPRLTPLLASIALTAAMGGRRDLPQYHTLDYDLKLEFANGRSLDLSDVEVNARPDLWARQTIFFPLSVAATLNPFERVMLQRMSGTIRVTPEAREAEVLFVNLPRMKYKPGETVKVFVTYRPFRAAEAILPLELELPRDLPDGTYQLVVGDWTRYLSDEQMAQPFRFNAESIDDVFDVLKDLASMRHNALYLRLMRQPDGVAVGRVPMPRLPSSRRQVMLSSGRSDTTPFVSSTVKIVPTELLMSGSADFSIEINAEERVETAGADGKPVKLEPHLPAAPGGSETKGPKAGKIEPPREPDMPPGAPGDR